MAINWNLDASHSEVTFKVRHMMIANVSGNIGSFKVNAQSDDENFSNPSVEFIADMTSITTGDAQRDGHLKTADFFDTEKYPEMKFRSTSFGHGKMKGDLTINNITREIELDVEAGGAGKDPWGNSRLGFTVSGKINRKDWNLTWNAALESGGILVGEDVKINCEIQLIKG